MLKRTNSFRYNYDLLDVQEGIVYAHLDTLETPTESVERLIYPEELEYVFQLIETAFLHIASFEGFFPPRIVNNNTIIDKVFYRYSLPFKETAKVAEVEQWNDLVTLVSNDFSERKASALRGNCTYEQLEALINDCLYGYKPKDRARLNPQRLLNLIVFVYDYCIMTMLESRLHPDIDQYIKGKVTIRDMEYVVPLRLCAAVRSYCFSGDLNSDYDPRINGVLPNVRVKDYVKNPHANDSYVSAMFVDLMHKFFLSFGLEKSGKREWASGEKILIYEVLRLLGLCKSSKPAKESKYVTTVINDYGTYFKDCNLRAWIRENQAYSYLICCSENELTTKGKKINNPFISLGDYYEVKDEVKTVVNNPEESYKEVSIDDLPEREQKLVRELAGIRIKIPEKRDGRVRYFVSSENIAPPKKTRIQWDPQIDYVMHLIPFSFEYITYFSTLQVVIRQDLNDPKILSELVSSLEMDLLRRLNDIPRGLFSREDVMKQLQFFYAYNLNKEEQQKVDLDKLYVLFLFIFDYVYLTFKESAVDPHLRMRIESEITVCGENCASTMQIDDMLSLYLRSPYALEPGETETEFYVIPAPLYLRTPAQFTPERHPACSVKNMTAMFYELFLHFFKSFGLSKRSNAKYLSERENDLVWELARLSGICNADSAASFRTMFKTNMDYFRKSSLEVSIRENEYGSLMMNTLSNELFQPIEQ